MQSASTLSHPYGSAGRPASGRALTGIGTALATLVLSIVATASPVLAHPVSMGLGMVLCVMSALFIANFLTPAAPFVILFSFLFQNTFVALVSPHLDGETSFMIVRSYNFVLTATVWAFLYFAFLLKLRTFSPEFRRLMAISTAAVCVVVAYFALGLLSNPSGAAVYLRNVITPIMVLQICLLVSYHRRPQLTPTLLLFGGLILLFGYLELFLQMDFLSLFNGDTYIRMRLKEGVDSGVWIRQMQETGLVIRDFADTLKISLFNFSFFSDLNIRIYRLAGPNLHSISFAYAICFFAIGLAAMRRYLYLLAALPIIVIVGSKGAIAYLLLTMAAMLAARIYRGPVLLAAFVAALALYGTVAFLLGKAAQNYHVLGFLSGIDGFLANPVGHGLGAGGNLSVDMARIDWGRAQNLGQTDQVVESAVGVLLYQMGIGAVLLLGFYVWLALRAWEVHRRTGDAVLAAATFGLLAITTNGVFQEEALFAPLALGTMMLLAGIGLGSDLGERHHRAAGVRAGRAP